MLLLDTMSGIVYQKANAFLNLTVKFLIKKLPLYSKGKLKIIEDEKIKEKIILKKSLLS